MKKILNIFVMAIIVSAITSCNGNPFMNNLFSDFDKYELPSSFDNADDILRESGDDGFLDALADDPELTDMVIDILDDVLSENPADADQEQALLLADVYLVSSGADVTVNKVSNIITDPSSLDFENPENLITDLIDPDLSLSPAEQKADVVKQLNALLNSAAALDFYGETMINGQSPSPEVVTSELLAPALLGGMTSFMIQDLVNTPGNGINTTDEAIQAISNNVVSGDPLPAMTADPASLSDIFSDGLKEVIGSDTLDSLENMGA